MFSASDWAAHTPGTVVSRTLGLTQKDIVRLSEGEVYFA
jgi:hypothetical protein